jgi:hypothetical protein
VAEAFDFAGLIPSLRNKSYRTDSLAIRSMLLPHGGGWPGLLIAGRHRTEGAQSFAQFARAGITNACATDFVRKNKNCVGSIATNPCKERKDGAPLSGKDVHKSR